MSPDVLHNSRALLDTIVQQPHNKAVLKIAITVANMTASTGTVCSVETLPFPLPLEDDGLPAEFVAVTVVPVDKLVSVAIEVADTRKERIDQYSICSEQRKQRWQLTCSRRCGSGRRSCDCGARRQRRRRSGT